MNCVARGQMDRLCLSSTLGERDRLGPRGQATLPDLFNFSFNLLSGVRRGLAEKTITDVPDRLSAPELQPELRFASAFDLRSVPPSVCFQRAFEETAGHCRGEKRR